VHQCRGERNDCHAHREPGRTQRVYSVRVSASAQGDSDKEFASTILKACATIIGETLLHMSLHGTFETCRRYLKMSAHRGRPEVISARPERRDLLTPEVAPSMNHCCMVACHHES
jgi:hypothetical protein